MTYMCVLIGRKLSSSAQKLMVERNMRPKVSTEIERYFDLPGKSKSSNQCAIDTAFQKMKQTDLNSVNHARMEMEQKFPRAYSLHGGEHVVSLFFSDLSKYHEIKVSSSCSYNN